jgi:hypothetical protein
MSALDDDRTNLFEVRDVILALEIALEALRKVMEGRGPEQREQFVFQIGFARGRLQRVCDRIYPAKQDDEA